MKKKLPDSTRLQHGLRAANRLVSRLGDTDFAHFLQDEDLQDIVLRQFTVIGEAANHVSAELKERYPEVDWPQVVRFRNFLVHEYFRVDFATIWDTATGEVPTLIIRLEAVLSEALREEANNSEAPDTS